VNQAVGTRRQCHARSIGEICAREEEVAGIRWKERWTRERKQLVK
jgi:hypothetical protein